MGYDFASAVADLVDNSIEAAASVVAIDVEFDGDDSWVRIADNGRGMSPAELREAMRYGAERDYDASALGKFGLGLKTASMSQCQRLSVASRISPNRADIVAYCWDLDHILRTNRWEILPLERTGLGPAIREPLKETAGTVVLWQRLDRILGFTHPYGESARKRLSSMCRELEEHLAMVFHRFLTGEVKRKKFKILLNGNEVQPWDPFARSESATKALTPMDLEIEHEGVSGKVRLEPYVLPHQNEFSNSEAFKRASGPVNWNQQQGFYIYRAGRLIQSGGWCRLRTQDEHTKLARVGLSFQPALDDAFKINVAKMRVQLPAQLREKIELAIRSVVKISQETYRKTSKKHEAQYGKHSVDSTSQSEQGASRNAAREDSAPYKVSGSNADRLWTLDEIGNTLDRVAKPDEKPVIRKVIARVKRLLANKDH